MTDFTAQETDWIEKARGGDAAAFGELVLTYQNFVYHLAFRTLGDAEEAQDAAQEAFLRAWRGLSGFRGACKFSTWLYQITVNLCYSRRPRLRRDLANLSLDEGSGVGNNIVFLDHAPLPGDALEARQEQQQLQALVDALPPEYRLLICLRYQQELSYEEIAQATQMPLGTVKTGLFRAKARLHQQMTAAGETQMHSAPAERQEVQ